MKNYKKIALLSLCLSVISCGSSSSGDADNGSGDQGNPSAVDNETGNSKSTYCVGPDILNESDDVFVVFDALEIDEVPPSIANVDAIFYTNVPLITSLLNLYMTSGPMFSVALCNEAAVNNVCEFNFGEISNSNGSISSDVLTVETFTKSPGVLIFDFRKSLYVGDIEPYWEGSQTEFEDPSIVDSEERTISWRRDASTEYVEVNYNNGDFVKASESSNCSGTASSRDTTISGAVITVDAFWQISGDTTIGELVRCESSNCRTLIW